MGRLSIRVLLIVAVLAIGMPVLASAAQVSRSEQVWLDAFLRHDETDHCWDTFAEITLRIDMTHTPPGPPRRTSTIDLYTFRRNACTNYLISLDGTATVSPKNFKYNHDLTQASLSLSMDVTVREWFGQSGSSRSEVVTIDLRFLPDGDLIEQSYNGMSNANVKERHHELWRQLKVEGSLLHDGFDYETDGGAGAISIISEHKVTIR